MNKRTVGCVLLGGLLMAGVSLQAHHSLAGVHDLEEGMPGYQGYVGRGRCSS